MAGTKGLAPDTYRLAFPATRKEVESEYPAMSTKAKKLLTALRVKRQRRESKDGKEAQAK